MARNVAQKKQGLDLKPNFETYYKAIVIKTA